jgi:hypothetical protein
MNAGRKPALAKPGGSTIHRNAPRQGAILTQAWKLRYKNVVFYARRPD